MKKLGSRQVFVYMYIFHSSWSFFRKQNSAAFLFCLFTASGVEHFCLLFSFSLCLMSLKQ